MRNLFVSGALIPWLLCAAELPDLRSVPADLETPPMIIGTPAAGKRVRQTTLGWESTEAHHALYLPSNWKPGGRFPVIVEYAGNGNYRNRFGDESRGTVDGSHLGYGLSGGTNFIWICMPFVKIDGTNKSNAITWWGDVAETKRYCTNTVRFICERYGGDPQRVVLAGFSRGGIAANFIGLHDDTIATTWRAFFCYSHYDGVRQWPYPSADRASALTRLQRLGARAQLICGEDTNAAETEKYLRPLLPDANLTFLSTGFRNHNDAWILRPSLARDQARQWLTKVAAAR